MRIYKKSQSVGRHVILMIIILLAVLIVLSIIIWQSKGVLNSYLGAILD